jgi:hypothetical protein
MMGDLTLMRLSESRYMIFGSGCLQASAIWLSSADE